MADENREQAQALLDGTWTESYRLKQGDRDACHEILRRLVESSDDAGGYTVANIQAYRGSAVVTLRFDNETTPVQNALAAELITDAAPKLGQICKKILAHWDTGGDRMEKLEELAAAVDGVAQFDGEPAAVSRLVRAREALR